MSACEEQQYVGDNSIDKNHQDLISKIHLSSRHNVDPSSEKNSTPDEQVIVFNLAPQRKQLQRKRSVFSFNGFPNIQLLDQQLLKTRDTSVAHQDVSVPDNHASNNFGSATGANNSLLTCRSTRLDNLGSTGSSRASSCDEPGVVAANRWACSPVIPAHSPNKLPRFGREGDLSTDIISSSSNSSLESICSPTYQRDISPSKPIISAQAVISKAPSTTVISNDEQSGATIDQNQAVQIVGASKGEYNETKQSTAPFESIRVKLKRNSMPDAQLIQRHIDNLISQNEAIIENWNNVSIRSYNSSKDLHGTLIGKKANCNAPANNQQSNSSAALVQPKQPMRRVVQSRQLLPSTTSILSTTSSFTSHEHSTNGYSVVHDSRDKSANFKLKQMIERKRSYNLAKLAPNFFPGCNSLTLDDSQLNLAHMSTLRHNFPRISQLEPVELSGTFERFEVGREPLENAIQNLCIKKRDDESKYTNLIGIQDIKQYQPQPTPVSRVQDTQVVGQQQQQQQQSFSPNYTASMKVRHESLPFKKRKMSEPNMKC